MFYSNFVLTKKGPLGKVWIAATLGESRIPKSFATSVKIQALCENIERPAVPFALRLSASLMLGVVRVYSRKSNIMLSDVNAILVMLSKHLGTKESTRNHKRPHDAQQTQAGQRNTDNITLSGDKGIASYDAITLPATKRRRRGISDDKIPWDGITNSGVPEPDFSQWIPTLRQNELDVFVAMDTIFPSTLVPQNAELPLEFAETPDSSLNRSSSRQYFHAREEDITLNPTGDIFENASVSRLTSFPKRIPGKHTVARTLFHPENSDEREQKEIVPSYQNIPDEEVPMAFRDDWYPSEPTNLQGIQLTPFQPRTTGSLSSPDESGSRERKLYERTDGSFSLKYELDQGSLTKKSVRKPSSVRRDNNDKLIREVLPCDRQDMSDERCNVTEGEIANAHEGEQAMGDADDIDARSLKRPRKKLTKVIFDDKTEISTQDFRTFLHDTTDIVLGPREKRVRAIRPGRNQRKINFLALEPPSFVREFSKDLHHCWEELVERQIATKHKTEEHQRPNIPSTENLTNFISQQDRVPNLANGTRADAGDDEIFPGDQNILNDIGNGSPLIDPVRGGGNGDTPFLKTGSVAQLGAGEQDSSSEEKMRALDDRDGAISVPSVSITGRSGSLSGPSATRSGEQRENLRDRLFDVITPADMKSYEKAKEQASKTRSGNVRKYMDLGSSDAIPLPQPLDAGSEGQDVRVSSVPGSLGRNSGLFDIHTSDLQLAEETEKDDLGDDANRGPIDAIGIRAFKLLELLRSQNKEQKSILVDTTTMSRATNPIITVGYDFF